MQKLNAWDLLLARGQRKEDCKQALPSAAWTKISLVSFSVSLPFGEETMCVYRSLQKMWSKYSRNQHGARTRKRRIPWQGKFVRDFRSLQSAWSSFYGSSASWWHTCERMLRFTAFCNKIDDRIHTLFAFVLTDHLPVPAWSWALWRRTSQNDDLLQVRHCRLLPCLFKNCQTKFKNQF